MRKNLDERGYTKFRVISGTTIMIREQRKEEQRKDREERRIARLKERQAKKFQGIKPLFEDFEF